MAFLATWSSRESERVWPNSRFWAATNTWEANSFTWVRALLSAASWFLTSAVTASRAARMSRPPSSRSSKREKSSDNRFWAVADNPKAWAKAWASEAVTVSVASADRDEILEEMELQALAACPCSRSVSTWDVSPGVNPSLPRKLCSSRLPSVPNLPSGWLPAILSCRKVMNAPQVRPWELPILVSSSSMSLSLIPLLDRLALSWAKSSLVMRTLLGSETTFPVPAERSPAVAKVALLAASADDLLVRPVVVRLFCPEESAASRMQASK